MMEKRLFVDVILPLSLPRPLTYCVPIHLHDLIQSGIRVVVPLGAKKKYAAIVIGSHQNNPSEYEAKSIESVIDEIPIVTEKQIQFWNWIAEYYLCSLGEVMISALPPGLKFDSEVQYALYEHIQPDHPQYSIEEKAILFEIAMNGQMTLEEIQKKAKSKSIYTLIKELMEKEIIFPIDAIKQRFKPKTQLFIHSALTETEWQGKLKEVENKFPKQAQLIQTFLDLTNKGKESIAKNQLLENATISPSVLQSVVKKNWLIEEKRTVDRLVEELLPPIEIPQLSVQQNKALQEIQNQWENQSVVLLHGATGSGKTTVYAHLIEEQIQLGKQVLFLVPEIALTTQIVQRLKQYFGARAGVYHSGYNGNERTETWSKVIAHEPGEYDIIIGARSALLLPFERVGLIIVDEEHDSSYKQQDPAPRYNGRDAAVILANFHQAKVLLGSATPSIESYRNAKTQRYGLVEISERYGNKPMPKIELVDLIKERKEKKNTQTFSERLAQQIEEVTQAAQQVILFQNRRGYTPQWQCQTCGWIPKCTRCDVSLTYHKYNHQLNCHYCGYKIQPPKQCDVCKSSDLKMLGAGTEKIEEEIQSIFPTVSIQRMDGDTTKNKNSHAEILERFQSGEIQVLVGTQMVTKGLDFGNVTLVGIMHADRLLAFPDFRAVERSFQIMVQVAGRAGRGEQHGLVLIQTTQPEHWIYPLVMQHDYKTFYEKEIHERYQYAYPPFIRIVQLTLKNKNEHEVEETAKFMAQLLRQNFNEGILGPEKPFVSKINLYHIRLITIKLANGKNLMSDKLKIKKIVTGLKLHPPHHKTRINIDVDPQ
jgi:primosomal protein N' (replication factor Y)